MIDVMNNINTLNDDNDSGEERPATYAINCPFNLTGLASNILLIIVMIIGTLFLIWFRFEPIEYPHRLPCLLL